MTKTRQRFFLLFLAAVCALPLILSYVTYYVWKPERTMNYGKLMDMRVVPAPTQWLTGNGATSLQGKWVLFQVDASDCPERCERQLYAMRQSRLAMGVKKEKLEILWTLNDMKTPRPELLAQYQDLRVARMPEAYAGMLPQPSAGRIFLVDPSGRLVLRYPEQPDPERMIRDLARLLDVKRM